MKKKFLALVLTLAMVLSLVPATALATDGTSGTTTNDVVYGHYEGNAWKDDVPDRSDKLQDTVTTVDKTAKKVGDNQYEVTLTVKMKHKETAVLPSAAATVLVIDTSGSMNYCTKEEHQHTDACYQWAECTPQVNPDHYRRDGGHKILNTNCKPEDGRYIYPASRTCGKEGHTHSDQTCGTPRRLAAAKEAAENFLKSYRGGTVSEDGTWTPSATSLNRYVSVVWFNKGVSSSEWLDVSTQPGYRTAINKINALSANEGTNLDAGLRMANAQLKNNTVKDMPANVVVLTDGKPTYYLKESEYAIFDTVTIDGIKYKIKNNGEDCTQNTYDQTVLTARSLRNSVSGVYTVCFGASSEILSQVKGKPTVGTFLQKEVATQPETGSTQKYAYEAQDADELNRVFAAISSSVVSGLNTGTVTDALPNGVSCTDGTFNEKGKLTWQLDPGQATKSDPDGENFITYTYEKTYKVQINPTAEGLNVVEGGYVPLNQPTTLTVQHNGSPVQIPFPIPAGKVTYSLTGFEKALVTNQNKPDGLTIPEGVTIPATVPVVISDEGVTLLYKITVNGDKGAKFTVRDAGATLVSPTDTITPGDNSTFSGTVGDGGTTVFYVSKHFDVTTGMTSVSNTATIAPGDNAKRPDNDTATETTPAKEPDSQAYTVTYQWADENRPSDATLPTGNPFILNVGQKHTVQPVPTSDVKENNGKAGIWTCTWDATSNEIQGNAGENIIIKGTWSFQETVAPKGTLTVIKKVEGRTLDQLDQDKFKITVKGPSDYSKDLSLTDTGVTKDESKLTATWTISDLPTGTYTVSEENADVKGYDCTATYSATNGATVIVNIDASAVQNQPATDAQTVTVAADSTSTMTVTNKYTKQEVVPPTPADPVKLDVSRSKTAKPLDTSTWTSNVTLSLPSAEYEPVIDVVFILDDTYAGNGIFKDAATGLLNELSEKKNLDVNVGIVNFDAVARDWLAATTNSKYSGLVSLKNTEGLTALQNAIDTKLDKNNDGQTKKIGATNIEWPLEMAQNMLASGKGTEKYAILFSDMYGYVYRGDLIIDGQTYENVPLSKRLYAGESKFYQGSLSMGTKYQSFADVYAHRNDEENQTTDGFFRDSSWDSYWSIYSGHMQIPTNPATKDSADPFGVPGGYSGFEKSTCLVYDRLLQMKQAGINISIVNNDFAPGDIREVGYVQSIKNDMLDTLEQKGISVIKTQENVTAEDMTNVFDTLKDQLIQVVSAGSTVTDKIGTNFDFVGLNTMSLKIGDNTIPGVIDEATNTITFKHGGKDNAHVVVYDSSADSFTWTINEDVTKDARVQLTYSVKLTKPETAAGTYGVTDLNGDGKVDGTDTTYTDTDALYTNESATLVPVNSAGKQGQPLLFHKPSVSYTIKGSSGGHGGNGGGTVTIPDDVPTGLNGKDHYAYVVGYPDGMVYPQKNITRAEVATIFFRLLKDETREANMTKSNSYNDMKDGAWYTCAVSTLSKMGIIKGYEDGSFKPDASISRAEFAAIAARFDPDGDTTPATFSDVSSHWAKDEISIAANHGWIKGYEDGSFKPDQKITRAETMTLVNRVLKRLPETKDDLHKDMKTWPDNQNESAWFYLAVQEATNSHYQNLKKDGTHETWESMRETRDWAALEK